MTRRLLVAAAVLLAWLCVPSPAGPRDPHPVAAASASPQAVRRMVEGLRLVNYFPSRHTHAQMWTSFDAEEIERDLVRMSSLHVNAVRIVLDVRAFSIPSPPSADVDELRRVVEMADRHRIRVQLTLFDQLGGCSTCGDYSQIDACKRWVDAVLAPLAHPDPRIAFIELQNQIDPRNEQAVRWAQQMLPYVREASGGTPVTVSVDTPASNLVTLKLALGSAAPDLWDLHYYFFAGSALDTFREAASTAAPRPLLIGETGYSTYPSNAAAPGVPTQIAAHEAYQVYYLRTVELAAREAGLPPAAPWELVDSPCPGCAPAGCIRDCAAPPCVQCDELDHFWGVFRADGSPKPAAATLSNVLAGGPIDRDLNPGFERAAGAYPAYWRVLLPEAADFGRDTEVAHGGVASARIRESTDVNGGAPCWFIEPMLHPASGERYTLSAWVRGSAVTGTTVLVIAWFDYAGYQIGGTASSPLPGGDTPWTRLSVSGAPPPGAVTARLQLCSGDNRGTAWFDDVTLEA